MPLIHTQVRESRVYRDTEIFGFGMEVNFNVAPNLKTLQNGHVCVYVSIIFFRMNVRPETKLSALASHPPSDEKEKVGFLSARCSGHYQRLICDSISELCQWGREARILIQGKRQVQDVITM